MKYIDEFRDGVLAKKIADRIVREVDARRYIFLIKTARWLPNFDSYPGFEPLAELINLRIG